MPHFWTEEYLNTFLQGTLEFGGGNNSFKHYVCSKFYNNFRQNHKKINITNHLILTATHCRQRKNFSYDCVYKFLTLSYILTLNFPSNYFSYKI